MTTFNCVEEKYMSLVNSGELQYDENQYQIILKFMKVQKACKLPKLKPKVVASTKQTESTSSFFGSLWSSVSGNSVSSPVKTASVIEDENDQVYVEDDEDRRGIYLYGSVGIG